jgi:rubredoxin
MSIIPHAALTTVQIVSGLAASAKNAVDLAKSTSNNELKGAVSELYDSVLDVKARVLELDEEVRGLKAQLARREEIEGPDSKFGYFHFKSKPDEPLCPRCYQSVPSRIANMGPHQQLGRDVVRVCPVCGFSQRERFGLLA